MEKTKVICGWELNNPDPDFFDVRVTEVSGSCSQCEHLSRCSVPSESMRCLVPREGDLVELESSRAGEGQQITYYALVHSEGTRYVQLCENDYYWARASYVDREEVPPDGLSRLEARLV